jgi:ADP-heptose:LPS heptosyltransferase
MIKRFLINILVAARCIFFYLFDGFCFFFISQGEGEKKRVLVVRLDGIGDFIIWLDAARELKKLFPPEEYKITLLGNQAWTSLAEKLPYFDEVWQFNVRRFVMNPAYRFKTLKRVRQVGFRTVVQPTFSREFLYGDSFVRVSGAEKRIGSEGDYSNISPLQKRISDRWYTQLVPATKEPLTELERNAEFLRGLGLHDFQPSPPVYPADILSQTIESFDMGTSYFVIFPGAACVQKQWPADRFSAISKAIYSVTGWAPVLTGGSGEESIAEEVISNAQNLPWKNLSGKTTLVQMLRILNGARILISNDTSAVHMASAVGCPTVCIMGGGHFGRFFPYGNLEKNRIVYKKMDCFGCNWLCKYPSVRCVDEITVDNVWQEVCRVLKAVEATVCRTP